ncbi:MULTISPECIES: hypothetical protein [unclassified Clostridium]|uniref:hypothetical protein n=1 Tax=unclassified Clostridium TaxID=2614128 RepID=UPI001EEE73E6|nr:MULTISPECIES: hypothetical protein [unclassified Clostridium]
MKNKKTEGLGANDEITQGGEWVSGEKQVGQTIVDFGFEPEEVSVKKQVEEKSISVPKIEKRFSRLNFLSVNDEEPTLRKTYNLKESIVIMINQLKLVHPNANARFNSIVEKAIKHYYKYIMEEGGSQEE